MNINRKLFVEDLIEDAHTEFKFYMFGRKVGRLVMIYNRYTEMSADAWITEDDEYFQIVDMPTAVTSTQAKRPLPPAFEQALMLSKEIGKHFDHMRVDLLSNGKKLWFSELTVYNMSVHLPKLGHDPNHRFTTIWDIRKSWFLTAPQTGWRGIYAGALLRRLNAQ